MFFSSNSNTKLKSRTRGLNLTGQILHGVQFSGQEEEAGAVQRQSWGVSWKIPSPRFKGMSSKYSPWDRVDKTPVETSFCWDTLRRPDIE